MNKTVKINNESTTVILTCEANGTTSYNWEKENGIIQAKNDDKTLMLHNVLPRDSGRYRCVTENMYGRNYSNYATIFIKGIFL